MLLKTKESRLHLELQVISNVLPWIPVRNDRKQEPGHSCESSASERSQGL